MALSLHQVGTVVSKCVYTTSVQLTMEADLVGIGPHGSPSNANSGLRRMPSSCCDRSRCAGVAPLCKRLSAPAAGMVHLDASDIAVNAATCLHPTACRISNADLGAADCERCCRVNISAHPSIDGKCLLWQKQTFLLVSMWLTPVLLLCLLLCASLQ